MLRGNCCRVCVGVCQSFLAVKERRLELYQTYSPCRLEKALGIVDPHVKGQGYRVITCAGGVGPQVDTSARLSSCVLCVCV